MALREVRMALRSKEIVFWTVIWPLIWILMVAFIFVAPAKPVVLSIAVIDLDQGISAKNVTMYPSGFEPKRFDEILLKAIEESAQRERIELRLRIVNGTVCVYPCTELARKLIENKTSDIVIVIPPNASKCFSFWIPVRLAIFVKAERASEEHLLLAPLYNVTINISVSESLRRINATIEMIEYLSRNMSSYIHMPNTSLNLVRLGLYGIAFPLVPDIEPVKPKAVVERGGALGYTVLGGVGYIVMLSSMTQAVGILVYRKESGLLRRLLASPLRFRELIIVDLVSALIFQLIACAVVVAVGIAIGARIPFNPMNLDHWVAVFVIALASLFAYLLGLALVPLSRSARGASGLAVALSLMFVFTTGIWWPPKEMLPLPLRFFAEIFPPALAFDVARSILVWGRPLISVSNELGIAILGTVVLAFIVALIYFRRFERIVLRVLGY